MKCNKQLHWMSKIPAVLLPPHHEYTGNLLWNASDVIGREVEISASINQLRGLGYWASELAPL